MERNILKVTSINSLLTEILSHFENHNMTGLDKSQRIQTFIKLNSELPIM